MTFVYIYARVKSIFTASELTRTAPVVCCGRWASLILDTGLEAYGMALFTRVLGRSREEMEKLFENARKEVMQKKVHAYQGHRFLIARKKGG